MRASFPKTLPQWGTVGAAVAVLALLANAIPQRDVRAEQAELDGVLTQASPEAVMRIRRGCAGGAQPDSIARLRAAGASELPDATEYCVAALTRLGRDGTLAYVRDDRGLTPALAFDTGFVSAYQSEEAPPRGLPALASLKPIAERCLAQQEHDTELCRAAGQVFGARIAHGEPVRIL